MVPRICAFPRMPPRVAGWPGLRPVWPAPGNRWLRGLSGHRRPRQRGNWSPGPRAGLWEPLQGQDRTGGWVAAPGGPGPAGPGVALRAAVSSPSWPALREALVINSLSKTGQGGSWGSQGWSPQAPAPSQGRKGAGSSRQDHLPARPAGVAQGPWHSAPWSPSQEEQVPGSEGTPFQVLGLCLCPPQPRKGQSREGGRRATRWAVPFHPHARPWGPWAPVSSGPGLLRPGVSILSRRGLGGDPTPGVSGRWGPPDLRPARHSLAEFWVQGMGLRTWDHGAELAQGARQLWGPAV